MKHPRLSRILTPFFALALVCAMALPASAFLWFGKEKTPTVADFSKNGMVGQTIAFSLEDFPVVGDKQSALTGITVSSLPAPGAGVLTVGQQPLLAGAFLDASALSGLRFQSLAQPTVTTASFTFVPTFTQGPVDKTVTVQLHLLQQANQPPIARNLNLSTYKNVAIQGYFDALDSDGDLLTFQLTSTPARGAVTVSQENSSQFVYTPYENKTGKDTFTYVALDPAGNVSAEAKVSVAITKANTTVTYADMTQDPAHKAAVRLAEEGIFVGQCMGGKYFFDADQPVSRNEFLTMAMACTGLPPLEDVTLTGFYDDGAIPTWAKGYVSSALLAGAIRGTTDDAGQPVFIGDAVVTQGEATVILDNLLGVTDVATETSGHWASQAAANLATAGVIRQEEADPLALATQLTRADAAQLLDGALDVLATRDQGLGWFK